MDPQRLLTAAPALILGAVMAIAAIYVVTYAVRGGEHRTRSGIRHLEHYANHPANRTRKEKP